MFYLFSFLFSSLLLTSCSTALVNQQEDSLSLPKWVTDVDEYCGPNYLCSVGEGNDLSSSEISARAGLARISRTQIQAKTYYSSHYEIGKNEEALLEESFTKNIEGAVDQIQEGVFVDKRFPFDGRFFSLVKLEKAHSKKMLEGRLRNLAEQLRQYKRDFVYSDIFVVRELLLSFDSINTMYFQVASLYYPTPFSASDLISLENAHFAKKIPLYLKINISSEYNFASKFFHDFFVSKGYRVVADEQIALYSILVDVDFVKEHMNVDGFEKRRALISVKNAKESNGIAFNTEFVFRSLFHLKEQFIDQVDEALIGQFRLLKLN